MIQSDHKPLLGLIGEQKPLPVMASPRMIRCALMLGGYDYCLQYRAGCKQGHCDALSRLPLPGSCPVSVPLPVETLHLLEFLDSSPIGASQIRTWTTRDPVLSAVYRFISEGWPETDDHLGPEFQPYKSRLGELSVHDGCVLWGSRIVIPPQGRDRVLKLLHEGHAGESRSKMLARMYVWWPKLDESIRDTVRSCAKCQERRGRAPESPLHPWEWPTRPWERVHADYCEVNGRMFLILIDAHSKWMDIFSTHSCSTDVTIEKMRSSFACWGVPKTIVTDNARCFLSEQFGTFCRVNGVRHLTSPCLSPKSNGLAERGVQTFKNGLYKQKTGSVETKVSRFLFRYRTTPNSVTLRSPAELFLGRVPRTHLDALIPDIGERVQRRQETQKTYRDKHACEREMSVGDKVFVSAVDRLRGLEHSQWAPGRVIGRSGVKFEIELCDGRVITRHADQVRKRFTEDSPDVPTSFSPTVIPRSLPGTRAVSPQPAREATPAAGAVPAPALTEAPAVTLAPPPAAAGPAERTPAAAAGPAAAGALPQRAGAGSEPLTVGQPFRTLRPRNMLKAPERWGYS